MRIGPYEVVGEIGRGGMGVVYEARAADGRTIALKVVRPRSEDDRDRFSREARLLALLGEEEGFVPLLDTGAEANRFWLAMPLLRGGTLKDRLARGPLGLEETRSLGVTLARALGRAHAKGVVHRDVKPANILFAAASNRPLLSDLGLAKHFRHDVDGASQSVSLSKAGHFRGTAGYMSPEQMTDAAKAGPPADVFALGAVLYECLTGRPAFEGATFMELVARAEQGAVPVRDRRPDAPLDLADAIERSLSRAPSQRPKDGDALADALEGISSLEGPRRLRPRSRLIFILAGLAFGALLSALFLANRPATPPPLPLPVSPLPLPLPLPSPATPTASLDRLRAKIASRSPDDRDGLITDLEALLAVDKKAPEKQRLLQLLFERSGSNATFGDYKKALVDLTRRLELDPKHVDHWSNRADCYFFMDEFRSAIADYTKALEIHPKNGPFFRRRGECWFRLGDMDKAKLDLEKSLELHPSGSESAEARDLLEQIKKK